LTNDEGAQMLMCERNKKPWPSAAAC
jgi:hypothetical protein